MKNPLDVTPVNVRQRNRINAMKRRTQVFTDKTIISRMERELTPEIQVFNGWQQFASAFSTTED